MFKSTWRGRVGAGALLVSFLAIAAPTAHGALVHGTADLGAGFFDFSAQSLVDLNDADIALCLIEGWQLCMFWGGGILPVPDSTVESITSAPVEPESYLYETPPVNGRAYVVRTGDAFYAKFAIRQYAGNSLLIEYWVQMDGTNDLTDDPLAVEPSTWGRVKALYR